MPIPETVQTHIDAIDSAIKSADSLSSQLLVNNTGAYARIIRSLAVFLPTADAALRRATEKAAVLAAAFRQFGRMGAAGSSAIEMVREEALREVAEARSLMEDATLTVRARNLGIT